MNFNVFLNFLFYILFFHGPDRTDLGRFRSIGRLAWTVVRRYCEIDWTSAMKHFHVMNEVGVFFGDDRTELENMVSVRGKLNFLISLKNATFLLLFK